MTQVLSNKRNNDNVYNYLKEINNYNNNHNLLQSFTIYDNYNNPLNCDNITLYNNHISFNCIINNDNIDKLILYITSIVNNKKILNYPDFIYLHINSLGGRLSSLQKFINFFNTLDTQIISIIENKCCDCAILLASLCHYRIIKKDAICILSKYDVINIPYYWSAFKQCENDQQEISTFVNSLINILCNFSQSKITIQKLQNYLQYNQNWNAKKCKKLGLVDEII
jgi:ATP-dependent protease ClpP protease subunit